MDHHFRVGAQESSRGWTTSTTYGRRPNGFYIPRYRNLFGEKRDYLRGFGYQGGAGRDGWSRAVAELGVGARSRTTRRSLARFAAEVEGDLDGAPPARIGGVGDGVAPAGRGVGGRHQLGLRSSSATSWKARSKVRPVWTVSTP